MDARQNFVCTYSDEEPVYPAVDDDDLWGCVRADFERRYQGRYTLEHLRQAFETVCSQAGEKMPLAEILRKVRLKWLWERPSLPRGLEGQYSWREIEPVIFDKK